MAQKLLILLLLLPMGLTQVLQEEIHNKPGFILEEISEAFVYHKQWTFINVFNLAELDEEFDMIDEYYDQLIKLLTDKVPVWKGSDGENHDTRVYPFIHTKFSQHRDDLRDSRKLLNAIYSLIGLPHNNGKNKQKRGVFDFVGRINKVLWGTLSSDDAEYYNTEIEKLYASNKEFSQILSNQTTIIKSLVYETVGLRKTIKAISKMQANDMKIVNNELMATRTADLAIIELINLVKVEKTLDNTLRELLRAVEMAYQGRISYTFLNDEVISQIGKQLPNSEYFAMDDLPLLLRMSSINIYTMNGKFIYEINVPELETKLFKIIKITSIPQADPNGYIYYWQSPSDYVIQNSEDKSIMLTNEMEIDKCMNLRDYKVCQRNHGERKISRIDGCLYNIFNPSSTEDCQCERKLSPVYGTQFIPLHNRNKMISYNSKPEKISVSYGKYERKEEELFGIKLLTLSPGTTIKSRDQVIYSSDNIKKNLTNQRTIQTLRYNIEEFETEFNSFLSYNSSIISEIQLPESKIDEKTTINTLNDINIRAKLLESQRRSLTHEEKTSNWMIFLFVGLGVLALVYVLHLLGTTSLRKKITNAL